VTSPDVVLEAAAYRYPDGRVGLHPLSVTFPAGRCTAVIGPNGSGKSTLLSLLNGLHFPQSGRVRIGDLAVTRDRLAEVRRIVGLVFQDPDWQLFCPTVGEDVAFGPLNLGLAPAEARARAEATLARVGLAGMAGRSPFHLSGGEKKLVSLATVLAMEPPVLALDEPTAGLDAGHRRLLAELVRTHPGTRILATHDLDFALDTAHRACLLCAGALVTTGPAGELLRDAALLRRHGLDLPLRLQGPIDGADPGRP
jgi:energy-coupling factor transporter ATP-binding protein EcfA2